MGEITSRNDDAQPASYPCVAPEPRDHVGKVFVAHGRCRPVNKNLVSRRTWDTPFTPLLRPGDSVHNVFAFHYLMSNRVSYEAVRAALLPGSRRNDKRRVERVCRAFAGAVFGDEEQAAQVLYQNTLFGAVCRGLSTDAQVTIANVMVSGPQADEPGWLLRSFASRLKSIWTRSHRSCSKCIQEDLDERGFPAWRVLHELAQVDRCVYHGCALQPDLPVAGSLRRKTYYGRLPSITRAGRRYDLEEGAMPRSAGCSRYLQGWLRAFRGETPVVAVDNWMQAVGRAIAATGGRSELHAVLESHIVREWDGTLADVAGRLRIKSGGDFLARELALATHPGCLAQRIVVMGALEAAGIITDSSRPQAEFLFGDPDRTANQLAETIRSWMRSVGGCWMPGTLHAVVDALASGLPGNQISTMIGSCSRVI
jgi:hypothetical protein